MRYLLFEGDDYYPRGGWDDWTGAFDTLEQAQSAKLEHGDRGGWAHVVDIKRGEIVSHKFRTEPWKPGPWNTDDE